MLVYVSVEGAGRVVRHELGMTLPSRLDRPIQIPLPTTLSPPTRHVQQTTVTKQGPAEDGLFLACAASDGYVRCLFLW